MTTSAKGNAESTDRDRCIWSVQELARLAQFERRAGVNYWHDSDLAEAMRDLVRDAIGMSSSAPAASPSAASPSTSSAAAPSAASPAAASPVPARSARPAPSKANPPAPAPAGNAARRTWGPPPAAEGRAETWAAQLQAVGKEAGGCRQCQLCESRTNVVFGVGAATVPLVFVGEAPGADEDRQGVPFVGRAGQLLTKIIAAIGLSRDDVYICNVLKCRPPGNRNPAPEEIQSCTPFLERQLEILRPKCICTLGLFASQYLLESTQSMGRLRGKVHDRRGIPVVPTYHPAALLRNPDLKAMVWEDVQILRELLDA